MSPGPSNWPLGLRVWQLSRKFVSAETAKVIGLFDSIRDASRLIIEMEGYREKSPYLRFRVSWLDTDADAMTELEHIAGAASYVIKRRRN